MLCAPAVIAMLLVTAYPILYAIVLSLQNLDLRFPDETSWAGLTNYKTVLTSSLWWQDVLNTVIIAVVSVAIELTLGMLIALVMYRAIFGRGVVRTAVLIPYGIVTVVGRVRVAVRLRARHRLRRTRRSASTRPGSGATRAPWR